MNYPAAMQIGARTIDVVIVDTPITGPKSTGNYVGKFEPMSNRATIYHADSLEDVSGEAFVHEACEAIDVIYDLKLPHQTIQTLSAALYQAFSSGEVSFKKVH